jgi:hypothetical protein
LIVFSPVTSVSLGKSQATAMLPACTPRETDHLSQPSTSGAHDETEVSNREANRAIMLSFAKLLTTIHLGPKKTC